MIHQLLNYTYKSFNNYTTSPNFFKNKNIIFGYNGRGKSSLARGIVEKSLEEHEEHSVRFFNNGYVQRNLLLDDTSDGIRGVKVSFSQNDADISQKIELKKNQIQDITGLQEAIFEARKNLRKKIDDIHQNKKGKAQINKKNRNTSIEDVLRQYTKDLEEALKYSQSSELRTFSANSDELKDERTIVEETKLPELSIELIPREDQDRLIEVLGKEYLSIEEIPATSVIRWLEKGISLHDKSEKECKFCNGKLNLEDIENRIREYRKNSKQKDILLLEKIDELIDQNILEVKKKREFSSNLVNLDLTIEQSNKILEIESLDNYYLLSNKIKEKLEDMENKIVLIENPISEFEANINKINIEIAELKKKKIESLNISISNLETLAKGAIALAIEESNIDAEILSIQEKEKELQLIQKNNDELEKQISELKNKQSEYSDFMVYLNEVLESLGILIELVLENNNYYLKHTINGVDLSMNKISEGEKNLFALLYFYYELFNDKNQKQIKEDIKLVVIDDPISSLDDSNKFYVLEIIKDILTLKKVQIFILTHSWDDFCQITYGKHSDNQFGLFEIFKDSNMKFSSQIRECKQSISPYKKLFEEIFKLKNKTVDQLNDLDSYHAANSMRRVFEEFLHFKKPNLLPQSSNKGIIKDIYNKATGKEIDKQLEVKLSSLLTFINVLSHRPLRSEEIISNSKTLMCLIEDIDKVHFDEMIR
ncbi:AAA family ATPase [Aerococcus urinaeequi]|uniref:AAA family ATPase n=1 Tax=Aerococcus urinaeequi TaxID=51665 RepID=UPI003AB0B0CF